MDATTVLAIVCSAIVLAGWVVLPHSAAVVKAPSIVTEERTPVSVSA
jgi:hypothetical protein